MEKIKKEMGQRLTLYGKKTWKVILNNKGSAALILLLILIMIFIGPIAALWIGIPYDLGNLQKETCPFLEKGNPEGLEIIYFTKPECPACWSQEISLRALMATQVNKIHLKKYDFRTCLTERKKYGIHGTPSFVFVRDSSELVLFGQRNYFSLRKLVDELTQQGADRS